MRVLILTVSTGYGHHSTAKAIADELNRRGAEVVTVDAFKYVSKFLCNTVDKGYLLSTKLIPKQFGRTYSSLESHEKLRKYSLNVVGKKLLANRFSTLFNGYMPDAIICTHVFAAQIVDQLKINGELTIPVVGIITDYTIHPFWEETVNIDYIMTASELLNYLARKKGIALNRILPFGIPVQPKFNKKTEKTEARRQLSLDPDKRTILVMGGSMGHGNILDIVQEIDALDMGLQIICICGNNEKLYKKINALKIKSYLRTYGFVNNVDLIMDAADCIVTKPGGLTVTEALAKKLPMILIDPIPGQEERNLDFLMNNGVALCVSEHFSISEAIYFLFSNPLRLELMKKGLDMIAHTDAADRLCDFLYELNKDGAKCIT